MAGQNAEGKIGIDLVRMCICVWYTVILDIAHQNARVGQLNYDKSANLARLRGFLDRVVFFEVVSTYDVTSPLYRQHIFRE